MRPDLSLNNRVRSCKVESTVNKALCCHFSAHNSHSVLLNHFHALTDEYIHCSSGKGLRIYGMLNKSQNAEK